MPLWRIYPVAHAGDSRWQGRKIWSEVVVRAPSAAMARVFASEIEKNPDAPQIGNESLGFRSGFEDEKLYRVVRINAEDEAALEGDDGPDHVLQVLSGRRTMPVRQAA